MLRRVPKPCLSQGSWLSGPARKTSSLPRSNKSHCNPRALERRRFNMLETIGLPELMVILVVAVLLFGGNKIPELAKGLGEGIRNFKNAMKDQG
jgi:sec-independent protein translocase protein TatA